MLHGLPALNAYMRDLYHRSVDTLEDDLALHGETRQARNLQARNATMERLLVFRDGIAQGGQVSVNGDRALPANHLFSYDEGSEDLIIFGQRIYADYRRATVEPDGTMTLSWVRGSLNLRLM